MKLGDLIPDPRNANKGTERGQGMLEASLRKYGAGRSILIDRAGRIIAGNKTVENAGQLGMEDLLVVKSDGTKLVAVQRTDLDLENDVAAKELAIADNRAGQVGLDWDAEVLGGLKGEIDLAQFWSPGELKDLLGGEDGEAPEPKLDKAAELQEKWKTALGQVWEIPSLTVAGKSHRLMCGDGTMPGDMAILLCNGSPQMVFIDPPYNALKSWDKDEAKGETRLDPSKWFVNDNMEWPEYRKFLAAAVSQLTGHSAYICCDYRIYSLVCDALAGGGWEVKHCIVWKKNSFGLGKRYRFQHEFIVYACRGDAPFYGDRSQGDVWEFDKAEADDGIHSTPKPATLPARAIGNSSTIGSIVLDSFNGTGTTTVAAERLGRICYGMEIEPKYVAVALERLADMGLQPRLTEEGTDGRTETATHGAQGAAQQSGAPPAES